MMRSWCDREPAEDRDAQQLRQQVVALGKEVVAAVAIAEVRLGGLGRTGPLERPADAMEADRAIGQTWERQHTVAVIERIALTMVKTVKTVPHR